MLFFFMYVATLVTVNGECYVVIATLDQTENNNNLLYQVKNVSERTMSMDYLRFKTMETCLIESLIDIKPLFLATGLTAVEKSQSGGLMSTLEVVGII